jgi:hypothetical protein
LFDDSSIITCCTSMCFQHHELNYTPLTHVKSLHYLTHDKRWSKSHQLVVGYIIATAKENPPEAAKIQRRWNLLHALPSRTFLMGT